MAGTLTVHSLVSSTLTAFYPPLLQEGGTVIIHIVLVRKLELREFKVTCLKLAGRQIWAVWL